MIVQIIVRDIDSPSNRELIKILYKNLDALIRKGVVIKYAVVDNNDDEYLFKRGLKKLPTAICNGKSFDEVKGIRRCIDQILNKKDGDLDNKKANPEQDVQFWANKELRADKEDDKDLEGDNVVEMMDRVSQMQKIRDEMHAQERSRYGMVPSDKKERQDNTNNVTTLSENRENNIRGDSGSRRKSHEVHDENSDDRMLRSKFEETT